MIDHDVRYQEARRWAGREVHRLAARGMLPDDRMLLEVMRAAVARPDRFSADPWAEETALAVIRRAAVATIGGLIRARRSMSRDRARPGMLLLGGALLAVLLDVPRTRRAA